MYDAPIAPAPFDVYHTPLNSGIEKLAKVLTDMGAVRSPMEATGFNSHIRALALEILEEVTKPNIDKPTDIYNSGFGWTKSPHGYRDGWGYECDGPLGYPAVRQLLLEPTLNHERLPACGRAYAGLSLAEYHCAARQPEVAIPLLNKTIGILEAAGHKDIQLWKIAASFAISRGYASTRFGRYNEAQTKRKTLQAAIAKDLPWLKIRQKNRIHDAWSAT